MTGNSRQGGGSAAGAGKGELRMTCRRCSHRYSAERHGGVCPVCGFDPFVELMHALDPLAWTARLVQDGRRHDTRAIRGAARTGRRGRPLWLVRARSVGCGQDRGLKVAFKRPPPPDVEPPMARPSTANGETQGRTEAVAGRLRTGPCGGAGLGCMTHKEAVAGFSWRNDPAGRSDPGKFRRRSRPSKLGPWKSMIEARLSAYPRLSAAQLFREARAKGYPGGYGPVKLYVRTVRGLRIEDGPT